ncbi:MULTISPECIES: zinc-binding alcohol dehydrogenase family protein [Lelliottia]|jgi:zinc-binding alcohol dehydrogenase family protein|uniref:Zinc-type alcohol dehydrogenase-like protein n=1 Tax=Lelliottia nimipressuralis TaxID=69220 RepID=A0ABY3P261_9ENTR|nr:MULTISPECIES: zinc-binding alcohol dehydrogenase family protein [Lelliottia]PKA29326.1 zinc-binding alcohol dehydrogenase family protein [Cedecea lapagei]QMM51536.1 zinc-binding alcohol dehydrogenase family protein [Enterobacter sp. RHB15-C17]MCY1700578.1 zinc-binding alcohol dehydrogenase family protein [Lelliottia sp. SL45]RXJ15375.1 zinc-binding alcohol dehydrogenase family protein [Lelliottia nimipressuralis]TYT32978.1 zinc-binding alcohol dehydrogenase family protein [Lelliottia nimipr
MSVKAIAVNPDQPSAFIEITQPMPQPGEHDLLVEVKAVSVNPVDTKVHASLSKNGLQAPRILGWDASGIVKAVGAGVTQFKAGDEVWYAGDITRPGSNATHQLIDARIVGHKPQNLDWAAAAALPLTALTAWEGLFERLNIQDAGSDKTLLIIGGAGGVGSLAIPFAKHNSQIKVIATASREDSAQWCRDRGADLVVNYRDLQGELAKHDITFVDYIFILNDTDGHWAAVSELIAPQGHICTIVENDHPLDQSKLKSKSAALHWEFMYTRSMYQTADMARQGEILNEVAKLVENGVVESSLSETLQGLSVESISEAHRKVLDGHMRGKVVVQF